MVIWKASRSLRLTGTVILSEQAQERERAHAVENFANFFDREKLALFCCLAIEAHTTKPSAEQDGEDDILNVTSPQTVVSMARVSQSLQRVILIPTCSTGSLKPRQRAS